VLAFADAQGWSVRVLGVFDGHGGQEASALAATELPSSLESTLRHTLCGDSSSDPLSACQAAAAAEGGQGRGQF